jgi:N-acetylglucosamine kinase-like BadF-type ATPase
VRTYLGIDGGGTKTDFLLIDESGAVLASHRSGSAYYLETGIDALEAMMSAAIQATLHEGGVQASNLSYAFIGLPAYGEDSRLAARLDGIAAAVLPSGRYRCGNDMVCGWAGALAGADGINLVAGTGSIAYGEWGGRQARAGGWGELFSDEGSAYWIAREVLTLFSRMSDGREPKGLLYENLRQHFHLHHDLDLCAAIYGPPPLSRSALAALAPVVAEAAGAGDVQAQQIFDAAGQNLSQLVHAVRDALIPTRTSTTTLTPVPVSYSGGLFRFGPTILGPFRARLCAGPRQYEFTAPKFEPKAGAALYAAKLSGSPMSRAAIDALAIECGPAYPADDSP